MVQGQYHPVHSLRKGQGIFDPDQPFLLGDLNQEPQYWPFWILVLGSLTQISTIHGVRLTSYMFESTLLEACQEMNLISAAAWLLSASGGTVSIQISAVYPNTHVS
jgi:hypothetical protein